jgi:anti-sigma factor RsiW
MHAVIIESLEEYLAGALGAQAQRTVESHLTACHECREEVLAMQEVSHMFATLQSEEAPEPAPGFYARVMEEVDTRRVPSFASLFSLDFAFGRRVVFASLLTLAVLGTYLVSRESTYIVGPTPEAIMAQDAGPAPSDGSAERGLMLVTLASYEQ